jgi:hypothetical protein
MQVCLTDPQIARQAPFGNGRRDCTAWTGDSVAPGHAFGELGSLSCSIIHDVRPSAHDMEGQAMEGIQGASERGPHQSSNAPDREKDALRVQAAAVLAQQAALLEDEIRIRRREKSVEEQETQLAAHLDERHRKLTDLRDQLGRARNDFEADREAESRDIAERTRQASIEHAAALDALKWAATQRRRLWRLRVRLKKRLHRHWQACQSEKARHARSLERERQQLEHDRNCVRSERETVAQMRRRLTSEIELSRRQTEDAWKSYRAELSRESAVRNAERQEVEATRRDALERQEQLAAATDHWELRRERLQTEVLGLETRIQNARLRLLEVDRDSSAGKLEEPAVPTADRPCATLPAAEDNRFVPLCQMTGDIVDQRAHLVEQWQQLLQARMVFEEERQQALSDLETMAAALEAQRLETRAIAERLSGDAEAGRQCRRQIIAEQAEWKSRQTAFQLEAETARTEWQCRVDQVAHQLRQLEECLQSSTLRQQRRWECVRRSLHGATRLRRSYVRLRRQWVARLQGVIRQERQVAERALAVEQFWQECTSQASDAVAADKRLEGIRQQWVRSLEDASCKLSAERREFECLVSAVNERAAVIDRQVSEMVALDGEIGLREQALQQGVLDFRAGQSKRDRDYLTVKAHRDALAEENARLRQELENIAAQLLDDEPPHLRIAA